MSAGLQHEEPVEWRGLIPHSGGRWVSRLGPKEQEVFGPEDLGRRQSYRAGDRVLEFPHVARPAMGAEPPKRRTRNADHGLAELPAAKLDEVLSQGRQVLHPVP